MAESRAVLQELILTLSLVWGALGVYSISHSSLNVAGVALEKTDIAEHLNGAATPAITPARPDPSVVRENHRIGTKRPAKHAAIAANNPPAGDAVESHPEKTPEATPPIDASPQRILMFGDSMIEELMLRLADYTQHNGHTLKPAIWYGSTTLRWSGQSKLPTLLGEYDPTFVIVVLGSSELSSRGIERRRPAIEAIQRQLGNRPFIWIGPPNWKRDSGINNLVESVIGKRRFFRSDKLSFKRKRDGIHPTRKASAHWMDEVVVWIGRDSAYPILLDTPDRSAPRPRARIISPE